MYDTNDNYIQSQSFRYICDQKQNDENPLFCEENNANNCPRIVDNIKCVKQCVQPTGTNILSPLDWQGPDGTKTTIFCQAGYHIKDNPSQTSQTITCTNLRYPNVDCIPEKCSDPKLLTLENGYCYADEGVTNFVDDQRAVCRCNKCFAMVNNRDSQHPVPLDQSLNCHVQYNEITCSNNEWLRLNDVKCEPLICGNPPQLENADLVFETNVITGQTEQRTFFTNATCGQKVYYECMPGYRAFFQNSDTETRPYAVCKADGSGCFDKIVGSCVPITCPRIEVPEANSWMPIYLGSDIERYHDYRTLNTEKVRNFQRGQDFAIGTQAVYECYEDFSAKPDCQQDCQSFFNKTVNIARDIAAANPSAAHSDQDSLLITQSNSVVRVLRDPSQNLPDRDAEERFKTCCRSEETDTTQEMLDREDGILDRFPAQIACHNSKVRRECMPDGRWSEPSHTCMCEKPAEVKMTECERFRWWRLENRMNFPTPPQYTWPINTPGGNTNTGSTSGNNNFGTSTGGTTTSQVNSNNGNRNTGSNSQSSQQGNGNFNQQTGTTSSSGILIASSALVPLAFVGN